MQHLNYTDFLHRKHATAPPAGFVVGLDTLPSVLFPFQRRIVQWALAKGKAALFEDTGLGKTIQQLAWAEQVVHKTGRPCLVLCPLAVAQQTAREARRFRIETPVTITRNMRDVGEGIAVANYDMLHHFTPEHFAGLVCDESSILKNFDGKTKKALIDFASHIPYRLACTATPAPNDTTEILNHAEFLGILSRKEILGVYFRTTGTSSTYELRKHAVQDFWRWVASWAVAIRTPADIGEDGTPYVLPPLLQHAHIVSTDIRDRVSLLALESLSLSDRIAARRASVLPRAEACAKLINLSPGLWLVWCHLNSEAEAITALIPGAVEVRGTHTRDEKEARLDAFTEGRIRVLVTKPSVAGHGMNWQHCAQMAFVGLTDSFESVYQAIRRCWRYGQTRPVHVHFFSADTEGAVLHNIQRKEREATAMIDELTKHMYGLNLESSIRGEASYTEHIWTGPGWTVRQGDNVELLDTIDDDSIGLTVTSPPFPGMYVYHNSMRDIGNSKDIAALIAHLRYLVGPDKLLRVTMPGRHCVMHMTQCIATLGADEYVGLKDFRGPLIAMMEEEGWIYYGEVVINKSPQVKALRTHDRGLLFKTLETDSSHMHPATADYLLQFRKPGKNPCPIYAGKPLNPKNPRVVSELGGWITQKEWIAWAHPVWHDIRETDTLNTAEAREPEDGRHVCPLQLQVCERAIKLWSNPGEIVLDPFNGIGSVGYEALRHNRQYIGLELKESYAKTSVKNMERALASKKQLSMF